MQTYVIKRVKNGWALRIPGRWRSKDWSFPLKDHALQAADAMCFDSEVVLKIYAANGLLESERVYPLTLDQIEAGSMLPERQSSLTL